IGVCIADRSMRRFLIAASAFIARRGVPPIPSNVWNCSERMTNADRTNFAAMRIIVVLNALWLVLSRPDLPRFALLPAVFFKQIPRITTIRFAAFHFPAVIEWTLYIALIASLIAVAFDRRTQFTAFAAALLLYRFAALEPLIGSISSLWFTCYTHLILG